LDTVQDGRLVELGLKAKSEQGNGDGNKSSDDYGRRKIVGRAMVQARW
jgi:hypothetical protein